MLDEAGPGQGTPRTSPPADAGRAPDTLGRLRRRGLLLALGVVVIVVVAAGVALTVTRGAGIAGTSSSPSAPPPTIGAIPAGPAFAPLATGGEPPPNVIGAIVVPSGALATTRSNYDQGNGPYDRGVTFTTPAGYDQVLDFFRYELAANQWSSRTESAARGGPGRQVLARHKGSDGYFWEVGVTVRGQPGQQAASTGPTTFDMRLLQVVED